VPPSRKNRSRKRSPYAADRGIPGAYEGETVTRRGLFTGGAMAAGGIATAAFALPALGFAVGPIFEDQTPEELADVGPLIDFNPDTYVPKVITLPGVEGTGEAGKTTIYVREVNPAIDKDALDQPYIVISTRCTHLGCPVRYVQASERFICPCHGGVYGALGEVVGGPPVRPLDRFATVVEGDRVLVGERFSVNSSFERFRPRDPSNHVDGLWQYLYPPRPTT
jgi:Rieske Fe-S protein